MVTIVKSAIACALLISYPAIAAAQSDLERARAFYNAGQFDESIAAAAAARNKPVAVPSATLISARARLERFRQNNDSKDLSVARSELVLVNPGILAPQETIEWQIGLGTALFLDNQPGPAAEMFTTVLPAARERLSQAEVDKLLEWWATALWRTAESHTGSARRAAYEAMHSAVREELERDPLSRTMSYWTVIAARGAGDFEAAWNSAVAGWIRAGAQPDGRQLRDDLDRFVIQTLIPERAQARTGQRLDARATQAEITVQTEQWRAVSDLWRAQG
jgi:hypothetical protein